MTAFASLANNPADLTGNSFESVGDLVRQYQNVEIEKCVVETIEPTSITVETIGTGVGRNAARKRTAIPQRWYLTFSTNGQVTSVQDETRLVLARLLAASDDQTREAVLSTAGVPIRDVSRALLSRETAPARDAAEFLLTWSGSEAVTEAYALCTLGEFARRATDRAEASHLFDAAIALAVTSGSCDAEAMAIYLAGMNATDDAAKVALLKRAAGMVDSLDDPRPAFLALAQVSNTVSGDLAAMSRIGDTLDALSNRYDNMDAALMASTVRAALAAVVDDAARSIEAYRRAIALAHQLGDAVSEARAWANLGLTYSNASEREKSTDAFRHATELLEHDDRGAAIRSYAHSWLGYELVMLGRVSEAESHLDAAFVLPPALSKWSRVFPLLFLENLRRVQGRRPEAIAAAREAIAINPTSLSMIWVFQKDLGQLLSETGDLAGAVDAYRASIDLVEARRAMSTSNPVVKARHFATRAPIYRGLESVLVRLGRFDEALAVAERIKARSLTDSLDGSDNLPLTTDEQKQQHDLNDELLRANEAVIRASDADEPEARKRQQAARAKLDNFEEEAAFRYAKATASTASIDTTAAIANYRGSTAIEYSILDDGVVAYVVRNGVVTARKVASAQVVKATTARLIDSLGRRELLYNDDAAKLDSQIFAPLGDLLPASGPLVIIPDGLLWRVPFAALRSSDGKFLVERYAISYAPSMTELRRAAQLHRQATVTDDVLAVGNPLIAGETSKKAAVYRGLSLGPLPDAAVEAKTIGALYGRSRVLTGAAATESAVKSYAGSARILHLATHGMIDSSSPLYSALILSRRPSDPDDGLLEMREIAELHLNADLAVLSACDTAAGAIYPGEGVIGLSWAFLSAGCGTTVVSQWKAESRSTSMLMIEFHRQLLRGRSVSEAMRRAQLSVMRHPRYRHPFYWATFVVVGSDAPVGRENKLVRARRKG